MMSQQRCLTLTPRRRLRNELLIRSDNRRSLWRTLEILLCRVGHLLSSMDDDVTTGVSDFNTTENCSDILEDSTKFILDLTIPTLPVCDDHIAVGSTTSIFVAPSMVNAAMCTQFRQANYVAAHGWNQAQHVIPSGCQTTCPAISYSTWVVPAACSNEPEDCRFYNHHQDACGLYDTASFVAGDACCACGGGALAIPQCDGFAVLSTDHEVGAEGRYFHADRASLEQALGQHSLDAETTFTVTTPRITGDIDVVVWNNANGGSVGDVHGRRASGGSAGDWEVGDCLSVV